MRWGSKRLTAYLSKTQIDRLGDRLRTGAYGESDVRLLDEYRRSFDDAYQTVVGTLRDRGFEPTGRPAKSTVSIVEKLRRESIRLSQMQDIAGCRIVVLTVLEQERSVTSLRAAFTNAAIVDRREKPSHGYQAVHAPTAAEMQEAVAAHNAAPPPPQARQETQETPPRRPLQPF